MGCAKSSRIFWPRASPNAAARHAVLGSPSIAFAGRSSGVYVIVLPYDVATHAVHTLVDGRGVRARLLIREQRQARVAVVVVERLVGLARLLGEPDVVLHRRPLARPQTVVVGDDEHRVRIGRGPQPDPASCTNRSSESRRRRRADPTSAASIESFAVAAHHQLVVVRLPRAGSAPGARPDTTRPAASGPRSAAPTSVISSCSPGAAQLYLGP